MVGAGFRRLVESGPLGWVGVLVTVTSLVSFGVNRVWPDAIAPEQTASIIALLVLCGVIWTWQVHKKKKLANVVTSFQTWFEDHKRLMSPNTGHSPMSLMRRMISGRESEVWSSIYAKTSHIHYILMEDLDYFNDMCGRMLGLDPNTDVERPLRRVADNSWRILENYHGGVVQQALRMRETIALDDESVRKAFSVFRKLYHDNLEKMKTARESAKSEFGLDLETDIAGLVLPETK